MSCYTFRMYCPKCFNNTLFLNAKGVIDIIINRKKRDSGRFLFNFDPSRQEEIEIEFEKKCDEFFKWYADFQNKEPITSLELITSDVRCENGCKFSPTDHVSAIGVILPNRKILEVIQRVGDKYKIPINLKL